MISVKIGGKQVLFAEEPILFICTTICSKIKFFSSWRIVRKRARERERERVREK